MNYCKQTNAMCAPTLQITKYIKIEWYYLTFFVFPGIRSIPYHAQEIFQILNRKTQNRARFLKYLILVYLKLIGCLKD